MKTIPQVMYIPLDFKNSSLELHIDENRKVEFWLTDEDKKNKLNITEKCDIFFNDLFKEALELELI